MKRKRFHAYFPNQERRSLDSRQCPQASPATLYSAESDVIVELQLVGKDLMHPAAALDHHARTVWIIQAGRNILRLAARIEAREPPAKRVAGAGPIPRRVSDARPQAAARRPPRASPGQIEMRL